MAIGRGIKDFKVAHIGSTFKHDTAVVWGVNLTIEPLFLQLSVHLKIDPLSERVYFVGLKWVSNFGTSLVLKVALFGRGRGACKI